MEIAPAQTPTPSADVPILYSVICRKKSRKKNPHIRVEYVIRRGAESNSCVCVCVYHRDTLSRKITHAAFSMQ